MSDMFLTSEEVAQLTGRKFKSLQIKQLRTMGIVFFVNAMNAPVVPRASVEGRKSEAAAAVKQPWVPNVMKDKK